MNTDDLVKSAKAYLDHLGEAKKLAQKVHQQQESNSHGASRVVNLIREAEAKVRGTVHYLEGESFKELDALLGKMERQEVKQKPKEVPLAVPVKEPKKEVRDEGLSGEAAQRHNRRTTGDQGGTGSAPK